jgi:Rha family phage regulatory protein
MDLMVYNGIEFLRELDKVCCDSREIAKHFEKEHGHVLRGIRECECSEQFRLSNFGLSNYINEQGHHQPCYSVTYEGFIRLAMGFTGTRAAKLKELFISGYMAALRGDYSGFQQIAAKVAEHDAALWKHETILEDHEQAIEQGKRATKELLDKLKGAPKRRNLNAATRAGHVLAIHAIFAGRCPCCLEVVITKNESLISGAGEFDHFYANSKPNLEHTWLICIACHLNFTIGKWNRTDYRSEFDAYQVKLHRFFPRQGSLW